MFSLEPLQARLAAVFRVDVEHNETRVTPVRRPTLASANWPTTRGPGRAQLASWSPRTVCGCLPGLEQELRPHVHRSPVKPCSGNTNQPRLVHIRARPPRPRRRSWNAYDSRHALRARRTWTARTPPWIRKESTTESGQRCPQLRKRTPGRLESPTRGRASLIG